MRNTVLTRIMITLSLDIYNPVSQELYDELVNTLQLSQIPCPVCHHAGCLMYHGTYFRFIKVGFQKVRLKVQRVKCSMCGTTHALLLESIVPYSQIPLGTQITVIEVHEDIAALKEVMRDHPAIDESGVRYIIRQFKRHWKERLRSLLIPFRPIRELVVQCFSNYQRQFMQIKRTVNSFFAFPT